MKQMPLHRGIRKYVQPGDEQPKHVDAILEEELIQGLRFIKSIDP